MTSCGGMFSVIVRRSTLTIRSTTGISRNRPGPFGSGSRRPRRKMIPRSYSRATLIAETRKRTSRKRRIRTMTTAAVITRSSALVAGVVNHVEREIGTDACNAHALPRPQRGPVGGPCPPQLPVHEDEVVLPRLADLAHHRLWPDGYGAAPYRHRLGDAEGPEASDAKRDGDQQRHVHVAVRRRRVVEQQQRADDHRDQTRDGQGPVADDVDVDHQQRRTEDQQPKPCPADRQNRKAEQREQQRDRAQGTW